MTTSNITESKKCGHIQCDSEKLIDSGYCKFHFDGGVFGNGDTFDQYQIIEQDFIDFIKVVPLGEEYHLKVCSPVLRDIIIRSCVQIEVFFKEWARYECFENNESPLFKEHNEIVKKTKLIKGERNWKIGSYYLFKERFPSSDKLFVRHMKNEITPFSSWKSKNEPPFWWDAYNSIKHNGIDSKKKANLENALYSVGALFYLHCSNRYSRNFLNEFNSYSIRSHNDKGVRMNFQGITTPIDSKRFLFKWIQDREHSVDLRSVKDSNVSRISKKNFLG